MSKSIFVTSFAAMAALVSPAHAGTNTTTGYRTSKPVLVQAGVVMPAILCVLVLAGSAIADALWRRGAKTNHRMQLSSTIDIFEPVGALSPRLSR